MISIKEYATKHNITYEAVRRQVVKYEKDLEGHITTENRKRFLDEFAEEFLNEKRAGSPVVIIEQDKNQHELMTAQIISLQNKLIHRDEELLELNKELRELQQENLRLQQQILELRKEPEIQSQHTEERSADDLDKIQTNQNANLPQKFRMFFRKFRK